MEATRTETTIETEPTFTRWNLGGNNIVMGCALPDGSSAVWYPEDCLQVGAWFDAPTLCIFAEDDEEWTRPLLQIECGDLSTARSALSAYLSN